MMRRGFSLLELAIVVAISGLMLSYVIQINHSTNNADCIQSTRVQLNVIRNAVELFARKNNRLPLPAARNIGVESLQYGRESSGANIDAAGGASWGAVPFQALGLSPAFAGDCWGNKFTYVVTTALTTSNSSGGYQDSLVLGNITQKSNATVNFSTTTAYAIISHGTDQLGAVKLNYTAANPTHGWCSGSANIAYTNCLATGATIASADYNDGKDAAANYFDDLVIAAGKPKIIVVGGNAYCWGRNSSGQLGDGTTTQRTTPTLVNTSVTFSQISPSSSFTCALTRDGAAYCWGANTYGYLGDNTLVDHSAPAPVSGGLTFTSLSSNYNGTLALTAAGVGYCWGYNGQGDCGDGTVATPRKVPTAIAGGHTWKKLSKAFAGGCGITTAGAAYCWGSNNYGQIGDGTNNDHRNPTAVSGGLTFFDIATGEHTCGLATGGVAYCWGFNNYKQVGDGTTTDRNIPTAVNTAQRFVRIVTGSRHACGLTATGSVYCWGSLVTGNNPTLIGGGISFVSIASGAWHVCGSTSDNQTYCFGANGGNNTYGQQGNGGTGNNTTPTLVSGSTTWPTVFGAIGVSSSASNSTCALQPPPPVAWGDNSSGQIGDGTTTDRTTPTYVSIPSGVNYFKYIEGSGGATRCAISDTGAAYCTGLNSDGQIGNGTTGASKNTYTAVTMPAGRTFTSIASGAYGSWAVADNGKPYSWGVGYYIGSTGNSTVPVLRSIPATTLTSARLWTYGGALQGGDNMGYSFSGSWADPVAVTLPGGVTSTKDTYGGPTNGCILGNDDQIYCRGYSDDYSRIGDGSTSTYSATYVPVTLPAGVTSWKALSVGTVGGGQNFSCAIGNNDQAYCWGYGDEGQVGNGAFSTASVPTLVTLPTGVSGWRSIYVCLGIVTAMGDDGHAYYWGNFTFIGTGTRTATPTRVPLPIGAKAYKSINGRNGILLP